MAWRAVAVVLLVLAGCVDQREPIASPHDAAARVAAADWSRAERIDVVMGEFWFLPDRLNLVPGRPYLLHVENHGKVSHNIDVPDFFQTAGLRPGPLADQVRASGGVIEVPAKESRDIYLVPLRAGRFPFTCSHILHDQFGMTGKIVVQ